MRSAERDIVEDLGWMTPWLARGGQPDEEGFRRLERELGITHDVNLRRRDEREIVERATRRMTALHIPVTNDRAPSEGQALRWRWKWRRVTVSIPIANTATRCSSSWNSIVSCAPANIQICGFN